MIVTDTFAFAHLPRSGGTFVNEVIKKFFPSAKVIGHHLPREFLPQEHSHLPVLGTVRNPWDFYVSWYHYILTKPAASAFVSWMTQNQRLGFTGSIENLLELGLDSEKLDELIRLLPNQLDYRTSYIPAVTQDGMRKIRGTGIGYYTLRFNQTFGLADDVFFCRVEHLRQDLLAFFDTIGVSTDELREYVLFSEKVNVAEHLHYSAYYTSALSALVSLRDHQLIQKFNYVFEQILPTQNEGSPEKQ